MSIINAQDRQRISSAAFGAVQAYLEVVAGAIPAGCCTLTPRAQELDALYRICIGYRQRHNFVGLPLSNRTPFVMLRAVHGQAAYISDRHYETVQSFFRYLAMP